MLGRQTPTHCNPSNPGNILHHLVDRQDIATKDNAEEHRYATITQRNLKVARQGREDAKLRRQAHSTHVNEEKIDEEGTGLPGVLVG